MPTSGTKTAFGVKLPKGALLEGSILKVQSGQEFSPVVFALIMHSLAMDAATSPPLQACFRIRRTTGKEEFPPMDQ